MTTRAAVVIVAACATVLGGCISSQVSVVEPGPEDRAPAATERAPLGEQITTAEGNHVTVHQVDHVMDVPGTDVRLLTAEVEICAARDGGGSASSAAYFRALVTDEGYRRPATPGQRSPLPARRLDPGDCERGWVGFPIQTGEVVESVVLLASTVVEWTLP